MCRLGSTYLSIGEVLVAVEDACATTNRVGPDGVDHDPELVHQMSVASMHGEFCTAISSENALALCAADMPSLDRCQGNE